jgi:hypothetical protein
MQLSTQSHKTLLKAFPLYLALALTQACGYQFRGADKPVEKGFQSLAIPLIQSTSSSLGFEGDFTSIIREEFATRSKVPMLPRETASVVLIGKVSEIRTKPLSYDTFLNTVDDEEVKYSVTNKRWLEIELDAKLIDRVSGKTLWHDRNMAERAAFEVSGDPLSNRYNQKKALQEIARRLAKRVYLKTMDRF